MMRHNIFAVLQERGRLLDAMLQDRIPANTARIESLNRSLPEIFRERELQVSLVEQLAANLPSFAIDYGLLPQAASTRLLSGHDLRETIHHGAALLSRRDYRNQSDARCTPELRQHTRELCAILQRYCTQAARGKNTFRRTDPAVVLDRLRLELDAWTEIRATVRDWVLSYVDETLEQAPARYSEPLNGKRRVTARLLAAGFRCAKSGLDRLTGRKPLYMVMMSMLYPSPETGFGTDTDAYNLFRENFFNSSRLRFGLARHIPENGGFELGLFSHCRLNAQGAIRNFSSGTAATVHTQNVDHLLQTFCRLTGQQKDHDHLCLFAVPADEYRSLRGEWFRQLAYCFGRVTSVKSLYGDRSLLLTRSEHAPDTPRLRQYITLRNVNEDLRRLITLARITAAPGTSLASAYSRIAPVVRPYLPYIFDDNVGILTSDLSPVEQASGFMVLPFILPGCSFPLVGITSCNLPGSATCNPSGTWSVMSARGNTYSDIEKITGTLTSVFGDHCITIYPSVSSFRSGLFSDSVKTTAPAVPHPAIP